MNHNLFACSFNIIGFLKGLINLFLSQRQQSNRFTPSTIFIYSLLMDSIHNFLNVLLQCIRYLIKMCAVDWNKFFLKICNSGWERHGGSRLATTKRSRFLTRPTPRPELVDQSVLRTKGYTQRQKWKNEGRRAVNEEEIGLRSLMASCERKLCNWVRW